MTQYLLAIHHPDNYEPSFEDEAMHRDIDTLNEEMVAACAGRWHAARQRRGLPANQRAPGRFLGAGGGRYGRSAGVGPQGCRRLPRAGRSATVPPHAQVIARARQTPAVAN